MPATTIAQLSLVWRRLLTRTAQSLARQTGCAQRASPLSGARLAQTLIFGYLSNPRATREELAQMAIVLGTPITPQALDARLTAACGQYLRALLDVVLQHSLMAEPVPVPLLQRFNGVYLQDSTTLVLPDALADAWPGGGCPAALKLQTCLDYQHGSLRLALCPARESDRSRSALALTAQLPSGALYLADLGYFALERLRQRDQQQICWVSRPISTLVVYTPTGPEPERSWTLPELLQSCGHGGRSGRGQPSNGGVDLPVQLGRRERLACRLLAWPVPPGVARARRQRLRARARDKGKAVSPAQMALAPWIVLVTNLPGSQLSLSEAIALARVRWQIELLFKLWKAQGALHRSSSVCPEKVLCETYAKLLALLFQHWILVVSGWAYPDRSAWKAARTIRQHARSLARAFHSPRRLREEFAVLNACLDCGCRINRRGKLPSTYQLLLDSLLSLP